MESTNELDLQAETLRGDVRDRYLDLIRDMPKGWTDLGEKDQRRLIEHADGYAREIVRRAFVMFAQRGLTKVEVRTGKWTVKDGIKLEVTATDAIEHITALAEHGQGGAVLVLADVDWFMKARTEPKATPDEPELPMGTGVTEAPAADPEAAQVKANTAALQGGIKPLEAEPEGKKRPGRKSNAQKAREMAEAGARAKAGGTPADDMRSSTEAGDAFVRAEQEKRAAAAGDVEMPDAPSASELETAQ